MGIIEDKNMNAMESTVHHVNFSHPSTKKKEDITFYFKNNLQMFSEIMTRTVCMDLTKLKFKFINRALQIRKLAHNNANFRTN